MTATVTRALRAPPAEGLKLSARVQLPSAGIAPVHPLLMVSSATLPLVKLGTLVARSPPLLITTDVGVCQVTCGERSSKLDVLGPEARKALLLRASYEPSPHRRKPHHLARDKSGVYFYVDRGSTPENEKDFRLYVGLKGQMKLQKMTNIVADTQGEIFETKGGSLRYIVPSPGAIQSAPLWVIGRKEMPLIIVPLESTDAQSGERVSNYGLIYNDLGVYVGSRLGNPCDDL